MLVCGRVLSKRPPNSTVCTPSHAAFARQRPGHICCWCTLNCHRRHCYCCTPSATRSTRKLHDLACCYVREYGKHRTVFTRYSLANIHVNVRNYKECSDTNIDNQTVFTFPNIMVSQIDHACTVGIFTSNTTCNPFRFVGTTSRTRTFCRLRESQDVGGRHVREGTRRPRRERHLTMPHCCGSNPLPATKPSLARPRI